MINAGRDKTKTELLALPRNPDKSAADYVVADMHGHDGIFDKVLELSQRPGDRIFIAGDITDRGPGSTNIIRTITENNKDPGKRKIYCVRGNHEEMCINTIGSLTLLFNIHLFGKPEGYRCSSEEYQMYLYMITQSYDDHDVKKILNHPIIKQFLDKHIQEGKKVFDARFPTVEAVAAIPKEMLDSVAVICGELSGCRSALSHHQNESNGGQWLVDLFMTELDSGVIGGSSNGAVKFSEQSEIAMIRDYLESLPYIIRVDGDIPFFIVHGDMPIGEELFFRLIEIGKGLTANEADYAMWARAGEKEEVRIKRIKGRNRFAIPAFVGHTIDGGVRVDTNTMNIDTMAYSRNCALVIQMPARKVIVVSCEKAEDLDVVSEVAQAVQAQLDQQPLLAKVRERKAKVGGKRRTPAVLFPETQAQAVEKPASEQGGEKPKSRVMAPPYTHK